MSVNNKKVPDYSVYHLHELERSLKSLDEKANPDEVKVIRDFIEIGGYKYPVASKLELEIEKVLFVSSIYKNSLALILSALMLFNILAFFSSRNFLSLVPFAFQAAILVMVYLDHKYSRAVIKVWSSLLIISGIAGFLTMYISESFPVSSVLWHSITFSIGFAFLLLANKSVLLIPVG